MNNCSWSSFRYFASAVIAEIGIQSLDIGVITPYYCILGARPQDRLSEGAKLQGGQGCGWCQGCSWEIEGEGSTHVSCLKKLSKLVTGYQLWWFNELDPQGESSDKDQRVLSAEDKPVQEAIGQLPDPTECHAQVIYWLLRHCFTFQVSDEKHTLSAISLSSFKPPFRFKFYFRFLQSVNREVAREVGNKCVSLNMKTRFFAIPYHELAFI